MSGHVPRLRPALGTRLARAVWRSLKIVLMAFAALGPAPPPLPPPPRAVAELRIDARPRPSKPP